MITKNIKKEDKRGMEKELKTRIEENANNGINKYVIRYSVERLMYKVRMFWTQRGHRLEKRDLHLIIWLTNKYIYKNKEYSLPTDYKPGNRKKDLFSKEETEINIIKLKKEIEDWYMNNHFIVKKQTKLQKFLNLLSKRTKKRNWSH